MQEDRHGLIDVILRKNGAIRSNDEVTCKVVEPLPGKPAFRIGAGLPFLFN